MKTFKIKGLNCYVNIDSESVDLFNIDSESIGYVADYEDVARYFLSQCEEIGLNESFEIEEVNFANIKPCVLFGFDDQ